MRPPGFWSASPAHPAARFLAPLGGLYGRMTAARMDRAGERAPCPVLCVGNFTLGGAGKTPTALRIAALLQSIGARPGFLTRGYGGRLRGPVQVERARHGADDIGDEPLLLSRVAPTILARDRAAGARLCAELGIDVVVMDDGLQNPSLAKDFSLAVVDAGAGIGNGLPVPAGPLRAPLDRQWRHVHGLVLIGAGAPGERVAEEAARRGLAVHRASLAVAGSAGFDGRGVLAFAGIGRPEKFFETLRGTGARVGATRAFPDHHAYRRSDLEALAAEALRLGAELVTTEKDFVRLPAEFAHRVAVLPVALRFHDEDAILVRLKALIGAGRSIGPKGGFRLSEKSDAETKP